MAADATPEAKSVERLRETMSVINKKRGVGGLLFLANLRMKAA